MDPASRRRCISRIRNTLETVRRLPPGPPVSANAAYPATIAGSGRAGVESTLERPAKKSGGDSRRADQGEEISSTLLPSLCSMHDPGPCQMEPAAQMGAAWI